MHDTRPVICLNGSMTAAHRALARRGAAVACAGVAMAIDLWFAMANDLGCHGVSWHAVPCNRKC